MNKILLVGELNPYGADPAMALYPMPAHASGARLQDILGLSMTDYLKHHDRANLCTGKWSAGAAAVRAQQLHAERPDGTGVVLCGVKVAAAFRRAGAYTDAEFQPFSLARHEAVWYLTLPHPSGLNRVWNDPQNRARARNWYDDLRGKVGYELKIPRGA